MGATKPSANEKIQALRAKRDRKNDPETQAKLDAQLERAWESARKALKREILSILRAGRVPLGALPTEAAIMYAVRDLDVITPWAQWSDQRSLARKVLLELVGARVGAVTQGEVVITGYSGGHEIYGLRAA